MLAALVELTPGVKEWLNVSLFERQDLERTLNLVHILEFLIDDGDKHVQENKERKQLENQPVEVGDDSLLERTVMHDIVPTFTCWGPEQDTDTVIEAIEVQILLVNRAIVSLQYISEKGHSSDCKCESDQYEKQGDISNVVDCKVKSHQKQLQLIWWFE